MRMPTTTMCTSWQPRPSRRSKRFPPILVSGGVRGTNAPTLGMAGNAESYRARAFGTAAVYFKGPLRSTVVLGSEVARQPRQPDHLSSAVIPTTITYLARIVRFAERKVNLGLRRVMLTGSFGLVVTAIAPGVSPGLAQNVEQVKLVFEHVIPNNEGKSMVAVVVTYPPGGKSPAHHHALSAFIYAHVLSGAIRSQVDDEPAKVYQVGEGFYELPGSHHRISENASDRDPASLLAVFIVDSKDTPLTIPDKK